MEKANTKTKIDEKGIQRQTGTFFRASRAPRALAGSKARTKAKTKTDEGKIPSQRQSGTMCSNKKGTSKELVGT